MQRSAWVALLLVVLAGWGIAGLMAVTPVFLVGWLGILIVGLAICFCGAQAELDDKDPWRVSRYCAGNSDRVRSEQPKSGLLTGRSGLSKTRDFI